MDILDYNSSCLCDNRVFKSIFESHFKLLRNFLIYKYKDSALAEDAAQNAFVILWENCKTLHPKQAKSFLFTTAIRQTLNSIKHNTVVQNFEINYKPNTVNEQSPHFLLEEVDLKNALEKAINNLPEKQRIVFLMNRFENQSYTEIASILGISVKAVEKRMHIALLSMRKVITTI